MTPATRRRAIVYVDGFNLYFGLKAAGLRHRYWLDIAKLAEQFLLPDQDLVGVKYFTARVSSPPDKVDRQSAYLDALEALGEVEIYEGHFQRKPMRCFSCNARIIRYEEKMTDVQIATSLLIDAFMDEFDVAVIVSGDGDLVPPVKSVIARFPTKAIGVYFPPKRSSLHLEGIAHFARFINDAMLKRSQLPDPVMSNEGFPIRRPAEWA